MGILGSYQLCAAVLKTSTPRKHLVSICLYTLYGLDKIALACTVQFRFAWHWAVSGVSQARTAASTADDPYGRVFCESSDITGQPSAPSCFSLPRGPVALL